MVYPVYTLVPQNSLQSDKVAVQKNVKLTLQFKSCGARNHSSRIASNTGVLALILWINSGDLQLAAVSKLRHSEEV